MATLETIRDRNIPYHLDNMDAHHCKIDLQSPSDLTYLLNNINTAAQQKIDLAIPRSAAPEGEDAYRSRVEELVQEVMRRSYSPFLCKHG